MDKLSVKEYAYPFWGSK